MSWHIEPRFRSYSRVTRVVSTSFFSWIMCYVRWRVNFPRSSICTDHHHILSLQHWIQGRAISLVSWRSLSEQVWTNLQLRRRCCMFWESSPQGQAALVDLPHLSMLLPVRATLDLALYSVHVEPVMCTRDMRQCKLLSQCHDNSSHTLQYTFQTFREERVQPTGCLLPVRLICFI